jgi:hypothetical protein
VLEMPRHTPIALGTSGALGVGRDTPRSIKIDHAHVGSMFRPPRRNFMRKHMPTWAKFRLPSTESLKNKTRVVGGGGGRGGSGMGGGGCPWSVFCPRETHTRRLVDISTYIFRRHKFRETRGKHKFRETRG